MASLPRLAETRTIHVDLISSVEAFYRILIDLDYLREEEVQFSPHTGEGKVPIATAAIQSAGLTQEAEQLLHLLPYVTPASLSPSGGLFGGEARITLSSKPVSYLHKGDGDFHDERSFGYGDDGEVLLPAWALQIFSANNSSEKMVIYDTRNNKISELSIYEPTEHELEAVATSPNALIGAWTRKLRSLAWIPWRDEDELWGMQTMLEEEEAWLSDPEKRRQELIERTGPTTLNDLDGNPVGTLPTAQQRFTWDMDGAKENHNRWWAKRLVYEGAGWPNALDKEVLRMRVHEFEQERSDVMDNAGPDISEEQAENEFYRRAAGTHGV